LKSKAPARSASSATASPPTTSALLATSRKPAPQADSSLDNGVTQADFNSYGSRRGNDRVMTRGTFANVRIKNLMLGGKEGGDTLYFERVPSPVRLHRN
jgi:aconitase A